ncbi:hypothetical protein [Aureibacter tunicatorum]|uniref:Gliding motility-associated C-terminal domain-containing protein n=1 Tax=Aureibacter tunicatorum TaxID=866807 RepID=A0AAE4BSN2_9BACT|nr:hypothetical protein [Aureibacter tunicatorum]MDR6239035.1 hypothetical protein [Aureibacter tunicatorum]BDD05039.1 hypothetical protein AUTU_25220 [Aureibacter tunicatorum]
MKNIVWILFFFIVALAMPSDVAAQCDTDRYSEDCLGKMNTDFTFVKKIDVDGKGGTKDKVETSYVFTKGTEYFLNVCNDDGEEGIVVNLYNSKRQLVGTNYFNGKFYSNIKFPCNATGIYYIAYTFKDAPTYCGGSVIGFKR